MRKVVLIVVTIVSVIFLTSCKKENSNISTSIKGTWELIKIESDRIINYQPGNGNKLVFTDSSYEVYLNNQRVKNGSYTLIKDPLAEKEVCLVVPANQFTERIVYDNGYNAQKIFVQISNNTLTLLTGCFAIDAGSKSIYVRR